MSLNFSLAPTQPAHKTVMEAIRARVQMSKSKLATYYTKWEEDEKSDLVYVHETELDAKRRVRRSVGVPQYTTIEVPYAYATRLSAHTYWTSVFLGRNPKLQFMGRHGESERQVLGIETIMEYQMGVGRMVAPIYVWLNDVGKYGVGFVHPYWEEEEITTSEIVLEPKTWMGVALPGTEKRVRRTRVGKGYVGNKLVNIRPQDSYPDPRVPLSCIQDGEYFGRRVDLSWNELTIGHLNGKYINIPALKAKTKHGKDAQLEYVAGTEHKEMPGEEYDMSPDPTSTSLVEAVEMYIKLVPKDWKLGSGERPEVWRFTYCTATRLIIEAKPTGDWHGKLPFFGLQYEIDGHGFAGRSMYEILRPLNDTISWLFNTHMYNVRAALNNQFVVDPNRVVMKDLMNASGEPGIKIRLKESAYGTDVRSVIHQIPVADVTQGHLRDVQIVEQLIQRVSGVTDNLMGMINQGGRKTATEIRSSNSFGVNRMKTLSEYWSEADYGLLAQVLLQTTQQRYDLERMFRIAGDNFAHDARMEMLLTPESIQGFYDFVPVDGTMPVDRYALANMWREILFGLGKFPQLAQGYNLGGMFEWMAQLAGMKNIKQFRVNVSGGGMLDEQARAGNLVPIGGGGTGGTATNSARTPEPRQISGMGPTG